MNALPISELLLIWWGNVDFMEDWVFTILSKPDETVRWLCD